MSVKYVVQLTPPVGDQCREELGITELTADNGFHGTSSGGTSWLAQMQAFVSVNAQMQIFIKYKLTLNPITGIVRQT